MLLALLPTLIVVLGGALVALFKPATIKKLAQLLWRLKGTVALIVAAIMACWYLLSQVFPSGTIASGAPTSGTDWTAFRGGPSRQAWMPGVPGPVRGGVNWSFTEVKTFYSSPSVVGNRLYMTSANKGVFADDGAVYCLDAELGKIDWSAAPSGFRATFSSPSVSGKYLVCGEGLHFTRAARIVCLDIKQKGKLLWEYCTQSHVESSPVLADGRVYIGAGDDGYYCFNLEPRPDGKPEMVWHKTGQEYPDAETSPVVHKGRVYVGLGVGGQAVCCLEAETGKELWRVKTPYPVFTPPTIAGDRVIVGMGLGNFIESEEEVKKKELERLQKRGASQEEIAAAEAQMQVTGEVWALRLDKPDDHWVFKTGRTVIGAVTAASDRLLFGALDGYLYSVDFDGRELGRWNARAPIVASLACTDKHVYCVTVTGWLYALEIDTLTPVWEVELPRKGPDDRFLSSPIVAHGHVYLGTEQCGLLSIGMSAPAGSDKKPVWAGYRSGPGKSGFLMSVALPLQPAMLWRYPKTDLEKGPGLVATAPLACLDDRLFLPVADGTRRGLACLRNPKEPKVPPEELWFFQSADGVHRSPAADEKKVYVSTGQPGEQGRVLAALNAETGALAWTKELDTDAPGDIALTGEGLYVADHAGGLSGLDLEGSVLWRNDIGTCVSMPAPFGQLLAVAVNIPSATLFLLDRPTGNILWRVEFGESPTTGPVVQNNCIYVGTAKGIMAHGIANGDRLWLAHMGSVRGALAVESKRIAAVDDQGKCIVVDATTGKVLNSFMGVLPEVAPVLTRDAALFAAEKNFMHWRFEAEDAAFWMDISWMGKISTPPVLLSDSRLYFVTEKFGLVRAGSSR